MNKIESFLFLRKYQLVVSKCVRLEWYFDWPQSIVESDPFALCPLPPLHLLQPHPFEAKSDFLRKKVKSEKF